VRYTDGFGRPGFVRLTTPAAGAFDPTPDHFRAGLDMTATTYTCKTRRHVRCPCRSHDKLASASRALPSGPDSHHAFLRPRARGAGRSLTRVRANGSDRQTGLLPRRNGHRDRLG